MLHYGTYANWIVPVEIIFHALFLLLLYGYITAVCLYYNLYTCLCLAEVEAPSGQRSPVKVADNGDGTVTINYQPTEIGLHNLHVSYNDEPLEGNNSTTST